MESIEQDRILWDAIAAWSPDRMQIVEQALLQGANASMSPDAMTGMSLLAAAFIGEVELDVVQLLLKAGAKTSGLEETEFIFETLTYSVTYNPRNHLRYDVRLLHCLFKAGVFNTIPQHELYDKIETIANEGELGSADAMCVYIEHLVDRGQDLSELFAYQFGRHGTLLHMAVKSLHRDSRAPLVQLLIGFGASVLAKDENGRTPIDLARGDTEPDPLVDTILETEIIRIRKLEAFMMGAHPHLGRDSMVNRFDPELLRLIHDSDPDSHDNPQYDPS
jgi:hypothetical protein